MGISFISRGSFKQTEAALKRIAKMDPRALLEKYGQEGVNALASATPQDSGLARNSWTYEVTRSGRGYTIAWLNTDVENGFPVAIMIQYGHGTGTGGYVRGQNYINPAIRPVFDRISEGIRKAVTF